MDPTAFVTPCLLAGAALYALRQRIEESFKISIQHLVKVFGCFLCNGLLVGGRAGRWGGLLAGAK